MSYSIAGSGFSLTGLAPSTPVVGITRELSMFTASTRAHVSGSQASIINSDRTVHVTLTTLASSVVGGQVLIDAGSNIWRVGTVVSDGTELAGKGGTSYALSTAAIAATAIVGGIPQEDGPFELFGTASSGVMWFNSSSGMFYATATTTLASIAPGATCLVEDSPGSWKRLVVA